ncbi:MAG: hypothetical protein Q9164_006915 [Protoblastenia rupestris]
MALALGSSQKRALSVHVGNVILDYYDREPPLWSTVGTATQAELRRLVIERLREKDCADVADILEASSLDTAVGVIKRRFKSLREKKRREEERKRGAGKQAVSEELQTPLRLKPRLEALEEERFEYFKAEVTHGMK